MTFIFHASGWAQYNFNEELLLAVKKKTQRFAARHTRLTHLVLPKIGGQTIKNSTLVYCSLNLGQRLCGYVIQEYSLEYS